MRVLHTQSVLRKWLVVNSALNAAHFFLFWQDPKIPHILLAFFVYRIGLSFSSAAQAKVRT